MPSEGVHEALISVVIPTFNSMGKYGECIESLLRQTMPASEFEVILVDDRSTDGSFEALARIVAEHPTWRIIRLPENSGSPSRPRNVGMGLARGQYVFFLDIDDLLPDNALAALHDRATTSGADLIRGSLLVTGQGADRIANRIPGFEAAADRVEQIALIVAHQSTNPGQLVRRELLREHGITWPEDLHVGEDTLFLIEALLASRTIDYVDQPITHYRKGASGRPSTTQRYGNRELSEHLCVWERAQSRLAHVGLSYARLRLRTGLDAVLQAIVRHRYEPIDEAGFAKLCTMAQAHRDDLEARAHTPRMAEIYATLYARSYEGFCGSIKQRLLIVGHDLKFIRPALPALAEHFTVEIDQWASHRRQSDAQRSESLHAWAEVILCEWALGNAAWHSRRRRPDQQLYVRLHAYELSTHWPGEIAIENVDAVIAVSVAFLEQALLRNPWPRAVMRHIPNLLECGPCTSSSDDSRLFTLALVGALPARKGLHRAIDILDALVGQDPRFSLRIYGQAPLDYEGTASDPAQLGYYEACAQRIEARGLSDHVSWRGWADMRTELADVGFVLSLSSTDGQPRQGLPAESFHLAVAEGFLAGAVGLLLRWEGAEYVYPSQYIFDTTDQMATYILGVRTLADLARASAPGANLVRDRYSVEGFVTDFLRLVRTAS